MLILSALWWSWVGYAWITSVVDPEDGVVRLVIFVAMAAFLVAALSVPGAFAGAGLLFAVAYAVVRLAQIALFVLASAEDPQLRRSVVGLATSTVIGVTLLGAASQTDGALQAGLWTVALLIDVGGTYLFGSEGWRLVPEHFAERHGLIVIIALGESIAAIGAGFVPGRDGGVPGLVVVAAVLGLWLAGALWWLYFDVVALVAAQRLENATPGRERNEVARDSYSYLHLPMVAGITLVAFGVKTVLGHPEEHLALVPVVALLGGVALYLLAHVAFRWRNVHRVSTHRLVAAVALLGLIPVAGKPSALLVLSGVTVLLWLLVVYEASRFAEQRQRLRTMLLHAGK